MSMLKKPGFRQQALDLITQATARQRMIAYPTVLVELLGDHHAAALMMQILYWGDRTSDPDGWFYKSHTEWQHELGLSAYQVRRCLDGDPRTRSERLTLRDLGVETCIKKAGKFGAPICHYRVDQAVFVAALVEYLEAQHGFNTGQGSEQCSGSIPNIGEDRLITLSSVDDQQSAVASSDTEITDPQTSSEMSLIPSPALNPDEDEDFLLFRTYEVHFGKARDRERTALQAQQQRLGASLVTEVLARCVGRGRSWHYVLRALENEAAPASGVKTAILAADTSFEAHEFWKESVTPVSEPEPELPAAESVQTLIGTQSAAAVWTAAVRQLELQVDRPTFELWLKGVQLVAFEAATSTFVIAAPHSYARDYCQQRLYRTIRRAVEASGAGEAITLTFVSAEDWLAGQGGVVAA